MKKGITECYRYLFAVAIGCSIMTSVGLFWYRPRAIEMTGRADEPLSFVGYAIIGFCVLIWVVSFYGAYLNRKSNSQEPQEA